MNFHKLLGVCCMAVLLPFSSGSQSLPLRYLRITSPFGYRLHPLTGKLEFHEGIDLQARSDTVYAVLPGIVVRTGFNPLIGNAITIDHEICSSIYGHLSRFFVRIGDRVEAGMPVGISGSSGRVTGAHLHFSIRFGKQFIDPVTYLKALIETGNQ